MVFIYDMAGSNYTNFELDLSKKILNLLKVRRDACLTEIFHGFIHAKIHQAAMTQQAEQVTTRSV